MSTVRFASICDKCGAKSEEYSCFPSCNECLEDTCWECCQESDDESLRCVCKECWKLCDTKINWLTHTHVFTSDLGWQGQYFGSLHCACGYALPYETPQNRACRPIRLGGV